MTDRKPVTISEDMTYEAVAKFLYKNKISGAPFINRKGKLIGLVSEKDLFRAIHPSYKRYH